MTVSRNPDTHSHIVGWEQDGEWMANKVRHSHPGSVDPHYHEWHPALSTSESRMLKSLYTPVGERLVSRQSSPTPTPSEHQA